MDKSAIIIICFLSFLHVGLSEKSILEAISNEVNAENILNLAYDKTIDNTKYGQLSKYDATCNCGPNSNACEFQNDRKVCSCQEGFAQGGQGLCVETCNDTQTCENGGACLQHVCMCLPGTSGPFCKTVDDCELGLPCKSGENQYCTYSVEKQKAICHCSIIEYRFDDASRTCKYCECTDWYRKNSAAWSHCEYQQGNKICTCREGYAFDPRYQICSPCKCESHSKWCAFNAKGEMDCGCEPGYVNWANECRECDCGKHGQCTFSKSLFRYIDCICDEGYAQYNYTCFECTCGKNGKCAFDLSGKQIGCECDEGYSEKSGKCEMCYCGDNSNCTYVGDRKNCACPSGYKEVNGFCEDFNECEEASPCGNNQMCTNMLGGFRCECRTGFKDKYDDLTCEDIDECQNATVCPNSNITCVNTLGSFTCICKSGYVSRGGTNTNLFCEKNTNNEIWTVVVASVITGFIITAGSSFYLKRFVSTGSRLNRHEMR